MCLGYEDLNDQDHPRRDWAWQTAAERDEPLASSPTLCRWENRADRPAAWRVQELLVEPFIGLFAQAPAEWVLDFDSTDDRVLALAQPWLAQAQTQHESSRPKQRVFGAVRYAAQSWDRSRRVLVKAEPTEQGSHPRFVVPNLEGEAQALYDPGYCARGELENRIKGERSREGGPGVPGRCGQSRPGFGSSSEALPLGGLSRSLRVFGHDKLTDSGALTIARVNHGPYFAGQIDRDGCLSHMYADLVGNRRHEDLFRPRECC